MAAFLSPLVIFFSLNIMLGNGAKVEFYSGHRFWKWDPNFKIENHIKHEPSLSFCPNDNFNLELIHQELLNRPFQPETSPWELLFIPNEKGDESLLALRLHHTMADAKSILKLLVECLGEKPLKTAKPAQMQFTLWEKSRFFLFFPLNYIGCLVHSAVCLINSHFHPWKGYNLRNTEDAIDSGQLVVGFSEKLSLIKMKNIAKEQGVSISSLLLSMITRAIQKCANDNQDVIKNELGIGYIFPKPDHPTYFTNHAYGAMLHLPLLERDPDLNIQKCHERFMQLKNSELFKCTDFAAFQLGTLPGTLRRMVAKNYYSASGVTNIGGEMEGFSLGAGLPCSEMSMSVGTLPGGVALVFCIFSYKQFIRIAVIANKCVGEGGQKLTKILSHQIGTEMELFEQ